MSKSPEEFFRLLIDNLHVKAVCCGYDYSFGYMAQGRLHTLKQLGKKYGVDVLAVSYTHLDVYKRQVYIRTDKGKKASC